MDEAVNMWKSVCVVRHVRCKHFRAEEDRVLRVAYGALLAREVRRIRSKPAARRAEMCC